MHIFSPIKTVHVSIACVVVFSFLVAATALFGFSPDYGQYEYYFDNLRAGGENVRFEPAFNALVTFLIDLRFTNEAIFGFCAAFPLLIKILCFNLTSRPYNLYLAILFYFSKFFPLWELTQLRVAFAASGIVWFLHFLFYPPILQKKRFFANRFCSILILAFSSLFHWSSIVFAPILVFASKNRIFAAFGFLALSIPVLLASSFFASQAGYIFFADSVYNSAGETDKFTNIGSFVFWPSYLFCVLLACYYARLTRFFKFYFFIKVFSICFVIGFSPYGTLAARVFELLSVADIFLILEPHHGTPLFRFISRSYILISAAIGVYLFYMRDFFAPVSYL